jgi:hypothetical protein
LILGGVEGLKWIEADSVLAGILVLENKNMLYSQKISEYL